MPKWARILIGLGVGLSIIGTYAYFFGVQTVFAVMWRYKARHIPQATVVPLPLRDLSVSNAPHNRLSYCGYEFELPWDDVDEKKSKTTTGAAHIQLTVFRSGNAFWFSCFPPKDFLNEFIKTTKLDPIAVDHVYGQEATRSDYTFHQAMFAMTPAKITPLMPRREAVRDSTLLLLKAIIISDVESGLFSVRVGGREGFQYGDPSKAPPRVRDDLFTNDGGIELIFFLNSKGSAASISQAEINRVLQSVQKVSDVKSAALR